ncbi:MAG: FkbM family methyltransferase [Pseudomonadota bacterium]
MKNSALQSISRFGNFLPHRQRRFVLDQLGLGQLAQRLSANSYCEVALPNGKSIIVNPLLHGQIAKDARLDYEEGALKAVKDHLGDGDVFYDIGANVGVFSFLAADWVGTTGAVCAFEPEENNLKCFRRSLDRMQADNVRLFDIAVGARDGEMQFDRRGGAFSGRLVNQAMAPDGETVSISVRSLDSVIAEGAPRPTLVKIDVEGGEGDVLTGAQKILEVVRPAILCELHFFNPEGVARALGALAKADYRCRSISGDVVDVTPDQTALPRHIIAIPN